MGIYNGVVTMAKTLLDLMYEADALQVDDCFIRHFYMEHEECEDDDDIVCHIELEQDFVNYEYMFTKRELTEAIKYDNIEGYKVVTGSKPNDIYRIIPYVINEVK
jgi:hypothetical protein